MALRFYTARIEAADDGGFGVFVPDLPGCGGGRHLAIGLHRRGGATACTRLPAASL